MENEKRLEKRLAEEVGKLGGLALKLLSTITGLPDRLCLLPGGRVFFAEIKTTGQKPRPRQIIMIEKLRALGFDVYVIDRSKQINDLIERYEK